MQLGIDFGTTRTIVAAVDRGNYPVVSFHDAEGDPHDHYPTVAALTPAGLVYGFDALAASAQGAPLLRSFKRELASPEVTPHTTVSLGDESVLLLDLIAGFLGSLRAALTSRSSLAAADADHLASAVIAVPAHAHSAQRFLTLEAFRRAGFTVSAMVNEPSAAGFEFTHRQSRSLTSRRNRVLVYDLGGGTFDASLVDVKGHDHEVLASAGENHLGGDDFDTALAKLAMDAAGVTPLELGRRGYAALLDEAREAKERLTPQSKRIVLDVADTPVIIPAEDFYAAVTPLVDRSVEAMAPLIGGLDSPGLDDVAGIYLVGGGSGLPAVPRVLKERFGRRVHRSPYPAASTAIGLAIAADPDADFTLVDRLSRGFGVFRESDDGRALSFDTLLGRDERVSITEPVSVSRHYPAAHNVGVFRFVEYSRLDDAGVPRGDIMPFPEVRFAFDPALSGLSDAELRDADVHRLDGPGPMIEERYVIDQHGIITAHLTNLDSGHRATYALS